VFTFLPMRVVLSDNAGSKQGNIPISSVTEQSLKAAWTVLPEEKANSPRKRPLQAHSAPQPAPQRDGRAGVSVRGCSPKCGGRRLAAPVVSGSLTIRPQRFR